MLTKSEVDRFIKRYAQDGPNNSNLVRIEGILNLFRGSDNAPVSLAQIAAYCNCAKSNLHVLLNSGYFSNFVEKGAVGYILKVDLIREYITGIPDQHIVEAQLQESQHEYKASGASRLSKSSGYTAFNVFRWFNGRYAMNSMLPFPRLLVYENVGTEFDPHNKAYTTRFASHLGLNFPDDNEDRLNHYARSPMQIRTGETSSVWVDPFTTLCYIVTHGSKRLLMKFNEDLEKMRPTQQSSIDPDQTSMNETLMWIWSTCRMEAYNGHWDFFRMDFSHLPASYTREPEREYGGHFSRIIMRAFIKDGYSDFEADSTDYLLDELIISPILG